MAKRVRLGRRTELPLVALGGYVLAGPLLWIGGARSFDSALREPLMVAAVIAFLIGALAQTLDKIDRHNSEMCSKIDDSVGDVYETGAAAERRRQRLVDAEQPLAVVRDLSPR